MKTIAILLLTILLCTSCASKGVKFTESNYAVNNINHQLDTATADGFIATEDEPNNNRAITFAVIENVADESFTEGAIVRKKCLKDNKVCFKNVVYAPMGLDRVVNRNLRKSAEDSQTVQFKLDEASSDNYCFRVVMFTDIDNFSMHTENFFKKKPNLEKLTKPEEEIWKLSGCKGNCKILNGLGRSPFVEELNGVKYRKYYEKGALDDTFFYPEKQDFCNLNRPCEEDELESQETFFYVIEAKQKSQGRCPAPSTTKEDDKTTKFKPLYPDRMSGDPRMRMKRIVN